MSDPFCCSGPDAFRDLNRRDFLRVGAAGVAAGMISSPLLQGAAPSSEPSEKLVHKLYDLLSEEQRKIICFDWEHKDEERGILRTHVSNNWNITELDYNVGGEFFTKEQQEIIREIFFGLYQPEWHKKIETQLDDDAEGYGKAQTIALFGKPGDEKFEFVMTGRHLTIRCDGNTTPHMAFGGPIFYGHAPKFNEEVGHPGNVFWYQAEKANSLYQMLDGKQRKLALIEQAPHESLVDFRRNASAIPGLPITELTSDQKGVAQETLKCLLEPFRTSDQQEVMECLSKQGGLDHCNLSFYKEGDLGEDQKWDIWRLEGPSFVWHYRGFPHVHVWVNISDDASVPLNAKG